MPVRSRKKPRTKRPRRSRKTRQNRKTRVKSPKSRRRKSRRKSHRQSRRRISKRIPKLCGGGADMDTDEFGEALYSSDDDRVDMDSINAFIAEKEQKHRLSQSMPVSGQHPLQKSVSLSAEEIRQSLEKLQRGDEVQPTILPSEHKKLIFMQYAIYHIEFTTITPESVSTYVDDKQDLAHEIAFAYSDVHKEDVTPAKYLEKTQTLVPQIASLTSKE